MRVVLLASGAGSLASAIFAAIDRGEVDIEIALVISDKDAPILQIAESRGLTTALIPMKPNRHEWDREIFSTVESIAPDLVVSVGFMRILAPDFVARFKVINTHPADRKSVV